MSKCEWHLCENEAKKKFCSVKCKNKAATNRFRKNQKVKAVEYKGGKCAMCGYDKCIEALHFHHLDPTQKDFNLSRLKKNKFDDNIKDELDKCILVCSNCHREIHHELRISIKNKSFFK